MKAFGLEEKCIFGFNNNSPNNNNDNNNNNNNNNNIYKCGGRFYLGIKCSMLW